MQAGNGKDMHGAGTDELSAQVPRQEIRESQPQNQQHPGVVLVLQAGDQRRAQAFPAILPETVPAGSLWRLNRLYLPQQEQMPDASGFQIAAVITARAACWRRQQEITAGLQAVAESQTPQQLTASS